MAVPSFVRSVSSGATATFTVPFPYLSKGHVQVFLDGVLQSASTYSWPTAGSITLTAGPPAVGVVVERRRVTPTDVLTTFAPGNLSSKDLNVGVLQPLFVSQEAQDGVDDLANRGWFTAALAAGGTITKGVPGQVAQFDADGNLVPLDNSVAAIDADVLASQAARLGAEEAEDGADADRVQTGLDRAAIEASTVLVLDALDDTEAARDAALTADDIYTSTAQAIGRGLRSIAITAGGSGGTNGTATWVATGGTSTIVARGWATIAGGAVVAIGVDQHGAYTVAPTGITLTGAGALTGATYALATAVNVPVGGTFAAPSGVTEEALGIYRVDAGPVATKVGSMASASFVKQLGVSAFGGTYPLDGSPTTLTWTAYVISNTAADRDGVGLDVTIDSPVDQEFTILMASTGDGGVSFTPVPDSTWRVLVKAGVSTVRYPLAVTAGHHPVIRSSNSWKRVTGLGAGVPAKYSSSATLVPLTSSSGFRYEWYWSVVGAIKGELDALSGQIGDGFYSEFYGPETPVVQPFPGGGGATEYVDDYPSPVDGFLTRLVFPANEDGVITISTYDMVMGKPSKVLSQTVPVTVGDNDLPLSLPIFAGQRRGFQSGHVFSTIASPTGGGPRLWNYDSTLPDDWALTAGGPTIPQLRIDFEGVHKGALTIAKNQIAALTTASNPWQGKKLVAVGDSYIGTDGYAFATNSFVRLLAQELGMTLQQIGANGATITNATSGPNASNPSVGLIFDNLSLVDADADLILVISGANDFFLGLPLGTITDTDNLTFYGAWNAAANLLPTIAPNAQIMFVSFFGASGTIANPSANAGRKYYDLGAGGTSMAQWQEAPMLVAERHGLWPCDFGRKGGLGIHNMAAKSIDGLHAVGQSAIEMSAWIARYAKTIPAS